MPHLDEKVREQVRPLLDALEHDVELKVLTGGTLVVPGRDATGHQDVTLELVRELAELSERVSVQEVPLARDEAAKAAGITLTPTILFRRRGEDRTNLRFAGLPGGYEFTTLLEAIRLVGSEREPGEGLGLEGPVTLQTFVTTSCPHCPRAVLTAFELALDNEEIVAEGVEAQEFPVISQRYRISSVPDTIIGGDAQQRVLGAQPKRAFVEAIRGATGAPAAS